MIPTQWTEEPILITYSRPQVQSDSVFYSIQTGSNPETGSTQETGSYDYRMIKWAETYNNTVHT